MFWRKKHMAGSHADTGTTVVVAVKPSVAKAEAPPQPKAEKPKVERLPAPRQIPGLVQKHLIADYKMDADLARILKAVVHARSTEEGVFNIRVFDESEAIAKKIEVKDYTSLDQHPDLTIYEGWFDEKSRRVKLEERKKISSDTPIFTEAVIQQRMEGLSEPGSSVFFYTARGSAHGGPLGMGAAVVELNPNYPKKGKKYNIYTADVVDMQPVGKGQKLFDSNKPKEIAKWIKDAHHRRTY